MLRAALYSTAHLMQAHEAAAVLADCPEMLVGQPSDCVLDVGCGPGRVTTEVLLPALAPAAVGHMVGVDINFDMVSHARRAYGHHVIIFEQLDITQELTEQTMSRLLPEGVSGFHKIFSFFCLHWVQEQRRALSNIKRLLSPGGRALLVLISNCPLFTMFEVLSSKSLWQPYMQDALRISSPYRHMPQPATALRAVLVDVGLQVLRCECRPSSYQYTSFKEMTDSMMAVNPFLDRIPEELMDSFIHDCMNEMAKLTTHQSNGHYGANTVQYDLLIACVQKAN